MARNKQEKIAKYRDLTIGSVSETFWNPPHGWEDQPTIIREPAIRYMMVGEARLGIPEITVFPEHGFKIGDIVRVEIYRAKEKR